MVEGNVIHREKVFKSTMARITSSIILDVLGTFLPWRSPMKFWNDGETNLSAVRTWVITGMAWFRLVGCSKAAFSRLTWWKIDRPDFLIVKTIIRTDQVRNFMKTDAKFTPYLRVYESGSWLLIHTDDRARLLLLGRMPVCLDIGISRWSEL